MEPEVMVALIASAPGILSVVVSARANHNAKRARTQVENNHHTNFREENDERHDEVVKSFNSLDSVLSRIHRTLGGLRDDVRANSARIDLLEELEITHPRKRFTAGNAGRKRKNERNIH